MQIVWPITAILWMILVGSPLAHAAGSDRLSYSGRLVNATGVPYTGAVSLTIKLYRDVTEVCSQTINPVTLANGVFNVELDYPALCNDGGPKTFQQVLQDAHLAGDNVYIEVTDDTNGPTTYDKQLLTAVPFAAFAANATVGDGTITASKLAQMGATPGQVLQWNGVAWAPITAAGLGTVTQINTGTGLSGGPITASGTISIAAGGVDTAQLANDAVTTAIIANDQVTTAKLANDAVTNIKVLDGTLTASKLNQSGASAGQVLKWNGAIWAPAVDTDTDSGGTVTQISTGVGLTGGPITASGTISIAAGGVVASMIDLYPDHFVASGTQVLALLEPNAGLTSSAAGLAVNVDDTTIEVTASNIVQIKDGAVTASLLNQMGASSGEVLTWNGSSWQPLPQSGGGGSGSGVSSDTDVIVQADNDDNASGDIVFQTGSVTQGSFVNSDKSFRTPYFRRYGLQRTLPTSTGDAVSLGTFSNAVNGYNYWISVGVSSAGFSQAKSYFIATKHDQNAGAWEEVLAISDSGAYAGNDFALDIRITNGSTDFRLRRVSGAVAGTANIFINIGGGESVSFTPSTATSSPGSPGTFFTSNVLTQKNGTVGIGTATPTQKLDVVGNIKASGDLYLGDSSAACAAGTNGGIRYNNVTNTVQFCDDGAGVWQNIGGVSAALVSFNTLTASTQTLAIGSTGTSPNWNSAGSTHTLNLPMASASTTVTAGLVSYAEYTSFNNKVDRAGDTMTGSLAIQMNAPGLYLNNDGAGANDNPVISWDALTDQTGLVFKSSGTNQAWIQDDGYVNAATGFRTPAGMYMDGYKIRRSDNGTEVELGAGNEIIFSASGTEYARFDGNGNIGVGTTAPRYGIEVASLTGIAISNGGVSRAYVMKGLEPSGAFGFERSDATAVMQILPDNTGVQLSHTGTGVLAVSGSSDLYLNTGIAGGGGDVVFGVRYSDSAVLPTTYQFHGGSVVVGSSTPDASALLDLTSSTQGFLPPRMTTASMSAIASPTAGLVVYNTDENKLNLFNGIGWTNIESASGSGFGNWDTASYVQNVNYQASTDGMVTAYVDVDSGDRCSIGGITDVNPVPSTLVIQDWAQDESGPTQRVKSGAVAFPVRRGDYWRVAVGTDAGDCTGNGVVRWIPFSGAGAGGGTASVTNIDIIDGTITASDMGIDSVTTVNILDGAVTLDKIDFASGTAGLGTPRFTTAQRDAIGAPSNGMVVFNTDTNQLEIWNGAAWEAVGNSVLSLDAAYDSSTGSGTGRSIAVDSGAVQLNGNNSTDESLEVFQSGNGGALLVQNTGTGSTFVVNDQASDLTPFIIDANGNVGIQTAIPQSTLHTNLDGGNNIVLSNTASVTNSEDSGGLLWKSGDGSGNQTARVWYRGDDDANTSLNGRLLLGAHRDTSGTVNSNISIHSQGNVGIGVSDSANYSGRLHIDHTYPTSMASGTTTDNGLYIDIDGTVSNDSTNYHKALHARSINYNIAAGQTDSGYRVGGSFDSYADSGVLAGTLNQAIGIWARTGINNSVSGGNITNAYGLMAEILRNDADGTVDNAFGIRVTDSGVANTAMTNFYGLYMDINTNSITTNAYGMYVSSASLTNYFAGPTGIGSNDTPDNSALLELSSTDKGFLPPRMTTAQRTAIASPANGLIVYNTDTDNLEVYNGSIWADLRSASVSLNQIDIASGTSGLGLPVFTTTQRNAIAAPSEGMMIWNTTSGMLEVYNGSVWIPSGYNGALDQGLITTSTGSNTKSITIPEPGGKVLVNSWVTGSYSGASSFVGTSAFVRINGHLCGKDNVFANATAIQLNANASCVKELAAGTYDIDSSANMSGAASLVSNTLSYIVIGSASLSDAISASVTIADLNTASASQGFTNVQMTTVQRDAIVSPQSGMVIYNTDTNQLEVWNGASWGGVSGGLSGSVTISDLDTASSTEGLTIPNFTTSQRDAIASPHQGMMVFNTDTNMLEIWNGTTWIPAGGGGGGVLLSGKLDAGAVGTSSTTITVPQPGGVLTLAGYGHTFYSGGSALAGVVAEMKVNGVACARDDTIEVTSGFNAYSSLSCIEELSAGAHTIQLDVTVNGAGSIQNNVMSWVVVGSASSSGSVSASVTIADLDTASASQGFTNVQMTTTQRDAIASPQAGMVIFNTDDLQLEFYNGSTWETVATASTSTASCPSGFTLIANQGRVQGCIQTDIESSAACNAAIDSCFDTYGGRLPTYAEIQIAKQNYTLSNASAGIEFLDGAEYNSINTQSCSTIDHGNDRPTGQNHASSTNYRCFIPLTGGGAGINSLSSSTGSVSNALFVDSNGNVGIGTTSPSSQLEVSGEIIENGRQVMSGLQVISCNSSGGGNCANGSGLGTIECNAGQVAIGGGCDCNDESVADYEILYASNRLTTGNTGWYCQCGANGEGAANIDMSVICVDSD